MKECKHNYVPYMLMLGFKCSYCSELNDKTKRLVELISKLKQIYNSDLKEDIELFEELERLMDGE